MIASLRPRARGWFLLACAALLAAAPARAVSVQPLVIDLQSRGRGTSQIVRVENSFSKAMPVEIRIVEAEYTDGGIRATERPSDDLLAFPPQALIAPGRTQSFRVQFVGDAEAARSRHYIVTVAQLPVVMPKGSSVVQILYNFNIVVGVATPGEKATLRIAGASVEAGADGKGRPVLLIQNTAGTYGYLANNNLQLVQRDSAGKEVFRRDLTEQQVNQEIGLGLVGPGQTRRVVAPILLPRTDGTLDARLTPARR